MEIVSDPGSALGLHNLRDVDNEDTTIPGLVQQEICMDGARANHIWQILKSSIQHIQRKQYSHFKFEELHRLSYYLIQHKYGGLLYHGLEEVIVEHLISKVQSKVLANLKGNFLVTINNAWDHHQTSMLIVRDILMYMDRNYSAKHGLDDVYTLGLKLFRDLVVCYGNIEGYLQQTLLGLVMKERQGSLVDRPAFRSATKMLVILGISSTTVYQENFEKSFLQQSQHFFRSESQQILERDDASLYLRYVRKRLNEELERSQHCFDEITIPQIVKVVEDELIRAHMTAVVEMSSGVVHMLQNQMAEDLACMYTLLGRVSDGLKTLFDCISRYLKNQGEILVSDADIASNAIIYVQNLLDLKKNIDFYVVNSFSNDKQCKQNIASDFEYILNLNKKSPEYLSLFIDDKLKKTVKEMTDDDKSILFDETMVLFRFLKEKDLFVQHYTLDLAKRLIVFKAINEENETNVINKLQIECGMHYTRRLQGIFQDIWSSSTLMEQFQKHVADTGVTTCGVTINLRLFKTINWPTRIIPSPCNLPLAPLTAFEAFRKFYLSRHNDRVLTLLPQLGSAELEACLPQSLAEDTRKEERLYTLQVTTYQMCVLMAFNKRAQWSFEDLLEETNISLKDLDKALQSLVTGKPYQRVLTKQPESRSIENSDVFYLNVEFTPKTNRIKIPSISIKYEIDLENEDTIRSLNEARKYEIEAAIVRVVKARKTINHEDLMNELMTALQQRFTPSIVAVKRGIEDLIARQFIARNYDDSRVYEYTA